MRESPPPSHALDSFLESTDRVLRRVLPFFAVALILALVVIVDRNGFEASNRLRQKVSMANLRDVAIAIEDYYIKHGVYPVPAQQTIESLKSHLVPYARDLPLRDGWKNPIAVTLSSSAYEVRSLGADGKKDRLSPGGVVSNYGDDLVFRDGAFWQWPHGL